MRCGPQQERHAPNEIVKVELDQGREGEARLEQPDHERAKLSRASACQDAEARSDRTQQQQHQEQ